MEAPARVAQQTLHQPTNQPTNQPTKPRPRSFTACLNDQSTSVALVRFEVAVVVGFWGARQRDSAIASGASPLYGRSISLVAVTAAAAVRPFYVCTAVPCWNGFEASCRLINILLLLLDVRIQNCPLPGFNSRATVLTVELSTLTANNVSFTALTSSFMTQRKP